MITKLASWLLSKLFPPRLPYFYGAEYRSWRSTYRASEDDFQAYLRITNCNTKVRV